MNILDILNSTQKPEIYTKSTANMWTDTYISKQLLEVHLNEELDLASRKKTTINATIDWILGDSKSKMNILDLGCGPGLYTEILAEKGHDVTGVDFSENSIEYAHKSAITKGLEIEYIIGDYLEVDLGENQYELIYMVFTDFGVLMPDDQQQLLSKILQALRPGGVFIFDVLNDTDIESKISPKSWEATSEGFWRPSAYIALSESFLYYDEKVLLSQHTIVEPNDELTTYRFWAHFYSDDDLMKIIDKHGFVNPTFHRDVLPEGDKWNGDNVTFCRMGKAV
jgi:2-polyprenyl-3-methyl-5-hydroxy-6-metoxy-1,4-benzoquinol methylase